MERVNRILANTEFRECVRAIEDYERDRRFCRHGLSHLLDTARVAYVLTLERHLDIPKGTVYAAALVHDLGRYDEYYHGVPHHTAHGRASSVLKACGYSDGEVASILDAVSHHREPSDGLNTLAGVLSRADKLSRPCYYCDASDECYWSDSKKNHTLLV